MNRLLAPLALLAATLAAAQPRMPATTRADLAQLRAMAKAEPDPQVLHAAAEGRFPVALVHGRCMVGLLARVHGAFDPASMADDPYVRIGSRIGDVLSFRVDAYHLNVLDGIPGLEYAELAGRVAPALDKAVASIHADSVQRGIWLPQTYTGRDVLIGITDWGFDYSHPMFYDTTLTTSRVRAAWDQWRQAGPAPAGFSYGTELATPEALATAQADTVNVYSMATHGTHVAGIAGGGGAGTPYRGVAFDAQYLFCTFLVDAAAVLDAFAWMAQVAEQDQKRLVVNMSWGLYYMGTLDGTSLLSQAINAYSDAGIVFVNSGGNNGDVNFHIGKTFAGDTLRSRVQFYGYDQNPHMWGQSISAWGEPGNAFSIGIAMTASNNTVLHASPWYDSGTQATYVDSFFVQGNDTVFFNLAMDAAHPLNGRPHARLRVKNTATQYRIVLKATAAEGAVHFWNVTELDNGVGNWGMAFQASAPGYAAGDHFYGISEPACTESLITAAAYNSDFWSNGNLIAGNIAAFSSFGPTLDGRTKPDIAAPGQNVASSISAFTDNSYTELTSVEFNGIPYPFARFSGTSMAAPMVTGTVALMLEADPDATPAEIKAFIKGNARTDEDTGEIPPGGSTRWGMGKLNAYQAVLHELGLVSVDEQQGGGLTAWPSPATSAVFVRTVGRGPVRITAFDAMGRPVLAEQHRAGGTIMLDVRTWATGVYALRIEEAGGVLTRRIVKE